MMINDTENATIYTATHIKCNIPNQNIGNSNSINIEIKRPKKSRYEDKMQRGRFLTEKKKTQSTKKENHVWKK